MGDTFGEEALISSARRNATISMLTAGTLMRLARTTSGRCSTSRCSSGFARRGEKLIARGGKWLDVRLPSEFENFRMEGAINLPLYFIRLKLKSLDRNIHYVACCDTGRRSSAAAYILSERGFQLQCFATVCRDGAAVIR